MKWIKYNIVQNTIGDEVILTPKKVGYSEENLAIAQSEAHDGQYEIIDDGTPEPPRAEMKTENWIFTLEDGSTVTKVVYVG
jgi:hypothetical protein